MGEDVFAMTHWEENQKLIELFSPCRVTDVPRMVARDVRKYAWQEKNGDKAGRQDLYKKLDWALDDTVIPVEPIE